MSTIAPMCLLLLYSPTPSKVTDNCLNFAKSSSLLSAWRILPVPLHWLSLEMNIFCFHWYFFFSLFCLCIDFHHLPFLFLLSKGVISPRFWTSILKIPSESISTSLLTTEGSFLHPQPSNYPFSCFLFEAQS